MQSRIGGGNRIGGGQSGIGGGIGGGIGKGLKKPTNQS